MNPPSTPSRRFLLPCALFAPLLPGCGDRDAECGLLPNLKNRAGTDATDCGHVAFGASLVKIDACVAEALAASRPFIARYDRDGLDSAIVFGIAGDRDGHVTFMLWDSAPCGGPDCDPVLNIDRCEGPTGNDSTSPPVVCTNSVSEGQTCG